MKYENRQVKYHAPNMQSLRHSDCRPSGPAEPTTCTVVTSTSSPSTTRSTSDVINDYHHHYALFGEANYVSSCLW